MKKSLKITDAQIIVALFTLTFCLFFSVALLMPGKSENHHKNFVGVDAAGFMHYPDGHLERLEIK